MTNDALQELAMKCSMAVDTDFENMADTLAAVSVKLRALSADRGEAVAWRLVQPSLGEFGVRPWRDMPAPPAEALAEWAKHGERIEYAYAAPSPAESAAPCQCAECRRKGALNRMGSPFVMDPLPTHDPAKSNAEQGLYRKFDVRRTDGSDAPGGKHHGCEYFVLDVGHDPLAKAALTAYAAAAQSTHPDLARDMIERYGLTAAPSGVSDADAHRAMLAYHAAFDGNPNMREDDAMRAALESYSQPQPGRVEGVDR